MTVEHYEMPDGRIGRNAAQLAASQPKDELFVLDDLPDDHELIVQTRNSTYEIRRSLGGMHLMRGGRKLPEWSTVHINGSTWGGSMLLIGKVGIGMHIEVSGDSGFTTSSVQSITLRKIAA